MKETSLSIKVVAEILKSPNKSKLCIALRVDEETISFVTGDLRVVTLIKDVFSPNAVTKPDFSKPQIRDCGHTVAFGEYEAAFSAL